jgi:hypothetical protein
MTIKHQARDSRSAGYKRQRQNDIPYQSAAPDIGYRLPRLLPASFSVFFALICHAWPFKFLIFFTDNL